MGGKVSAEYRMTWYHRNRDHVLAQKKIWRENNPDKERDYELRRIYGISAAEYDALVVVQNGVCAICERPAKGLLHVDHDHRTKKVRGLLCGSCNRALGLFSDAPERLRSAATYLERNQ